MTDNIIQLAPDGLNRVFEESLPRWPGLSADSARYALMMHRAGRDAATIAAHIEKPLGSVLGFLDWVKREESRREQAEHGRASASLLGKAIAPPAAERDSSDPASESAADEMLDQEATPIRAMSAPLPPTRETRPDIELNSLQQSLIRRLRQARVSVSTIAKMTRLSPDQVMRVAGKIP